MSNSRTSWLKKGKLVSDSAEVEINTGEGDIRQSFPLAVGLSRTINGKKPRLIVMADADFMSNGNMERYDMSIANDKVVAAFFSWLSYGEFPVDAPRMEPTDNSLIVSKKGIKQTKILLVWVLLAFLLVLGTIIMIRRKRK